MNIDKKIPILFSGVAIFFLIGKNKDFDSFYAESDAAKRQAKKAGKQFSKQPKDIAKKVAKYRAEYKIGTQGPCWDGYTYVGPKPYVQGSCRKD